MPNAIHIVPHMHILCNNKIPAAPKIKNEDPGKLGNLPKVIWQGWNLNPGSATPVMVLLTLLSHEHLLPGSLTHMKNTPVRN